MIYVRWNINKIQNSKNIKKKLHKNLILFYNIGAFNMNCACSMNGVYLWPRIRFHIETNRTGIAGSASLGHRHSRLRGWVVWFYWVMHSGIYYTYNIFNFILVKKNKTLYLNICCTHMPHVANATCDNNVVQSDAHHIAVRKKDDRQ